MLSDVGDTRDTTPDAINLDRPVLEDNDKPTMSPITNTTAKHTSNTTRSFTH